MPKSVISKYTRNYFSRFAGPEPILAQPAAPDCRMIIVIPCYDEPNLTGSLNSLITCHMPDCAVEVIIVVNQSETATEEVSIQNHQTMADFRKWEKAQDANQQQKAIRFHLLEALQMPRKHAGVGLARKTGMDEALRRFVEIDHDGSIVCLDADCEVSENYLLAIHSEFVEGSSGLGEMSYAHQFEDVTDLSLKAGIVNYELFLRYYVEGLRQAGFPNAIQTVGSCMLVKASVYAKYGGMNKRKAGEDFYFLHKIIPHEHFVTVKGATVYPSCRTSNRVPFGTGKAQQDWLDRGEATYMTYDPRVFKELESWLGHFSGFYDEEAGAVMNKLTEATRHFIDSHQCLKKIGLIKANASDREQFTKQFFVWFDGFMCMKYVHHLRDHFFPNQPIGRVAATLIQSRSQEIEKLLIEYRTIDLQH